MAIEFTDNGGQVERLGFTSLNGLSAITVMGFIKSDDISTDSGWIKHASPDDTDRFVNIRYDVSGFLGGGTNVIKSGIQLNGGIEHNIESNSGLQTTDWQHVCIRWQSGTDIQIIVNGVDESDNGSVTGSNSGTISGTNRILIGKSGKDTGVNSWDGLIEDVRCYSRYLSLDEINTIFLSYGNDNIVDNLLYRYIFREGAPSTVVPTSTGFIRDISGNGNSLTRSSGGTVNFAEGIVQLG